MTRTTSIRVLVTLAIVAAAIVVGVRMWRHYEVEPWTRDGRVTADVAQVAPDVSGLVTAVMVRDNQMVAIGTPLFSIDRPRFALAVDQAKAMIAVQQAQIAQARREAQRNRELGDLVAGEVREQGDAKVVQLGATLAQARLSLDAARLNLARTLVRAPVAGTVSNLDLRPGNYATAGKPAFAIIDRASIRIVGYFEETKLPRIHVGDRAVMHLMGEAAAIDGHVRSIAGGIEDRDRSNGASLLASVNPTFSWVRLAQRIPVTVQIDRVPAGQSLVVGRTATVAVMPRVRS